MFGRTDEGSPGSKLQQDIDNYLEKAAKFMVRVHKEALDNNGNEGKKINFIFMRFILLFRWTRGQTHGSVALLVPAGGLWRIFHYLAICGSRLDGSAEHKHQFWEAVLHFWLPEPEQVLPHLSQAFGGQSHSQSQQNSLNDFINLRTNLEIKSLEPFLLS